MFEEFGSLGSAGIENSPAPAAAIFRSLLVEQDEVEQYFAGSTIGGSDPACVAWRTHCFCEGLRYAAYFQDHFGSVTNTNVLDLACGWGGHAIAFAAHGAAVTALDMSDYDFLRLERFSDEFGLNLQTQTADCQCLPFADGTFDIVIALHVIEHIEQPQLLAREVSRVLRPGGVCFLATPARLLSIIGVEPHYGVRGLALLPFPVQGIVARKLLGINYPFAITAQYLSANSVIAPFRQAGLRGQSIVGGRLEQCVLRSPLLDHLALNFLWRLIVLNKPA